MSDVEFITAENHRRAREVERMERSAETARLQKKRQSLLRSAASMCFIVASAAALAAAVSFGAADYEAAIASAGISAIFAVGAATLYE